MKKIFILIIISLNSINAFSQNSDINIKFHSVDLGFGFFLNNNFGGLDVHSSVALKNNKNLYAITVIAGGGINILGGTTASFEEYNLQYGRELKLAKWISFDGFVGIGYYNQNSSKTTVEDNRAISLPLKINTKFNFSKHFGMGIMNNYSISKLNNNFTTNLLFHYKFN